MKGNVAKKNIENKLREFFKKDFIGVDGSKIYLYADDGGEKVQIALTMTCPKTEFIPTNSTPVKQKVEDFDWSEVSITPPAPKEKVEVTEEEKESIRILMEKLGL